MIYWDTACVLKLYVAESDSDLWQHLAEKQRDPLAASALTEVELVFAFYQKEARGDVIPGGAAQLTKTFRRDVAAGRFHLFPVGTDVIVRATEIAAICRRAKPDAFYLRTLDGLHLATAAILKCTSMATTDQRLQAAATVLKLRILRPTPH